MANNAEKFLEMVFPRDTEWWQPPHIIYRFSDARVREKLNKLMGTDVVKISDREFMRKLSVNRNKLYQRELEKRIKKRMDWEVERKKKLILEGHLPMSEGPASLAEHPIFKISKEINTILERRQRIAEVRDQVKQRVPKFNYRLLEAEGDDLSTPSSVSLISEQDFVAPDVVHQEQEIYKDVLAEEFEAGYMADQKTMQRFAFTSDEIERLRQATTVEEMYRAAEAMLRKKQTKPEEDTEADEEQSTAQSHH